MSSTRRCRRESMLMPPSSFASSHLVLLCFWIAFGNILKPSVGFLVKPCQYVIEKATRLQPLYSSRPRIVVIGAGVGGIATAARIKSAFPSCDVTVLEKNEKLGGRSGSFVRTIPGVGAFRHEQGPSLLLLPHLYRELFEDCSKDPKDFGLKMRQCIPAYQVVFDDGDRLNVGFPATTTNNNVEVKKLQLESRQKMNQLEPNGAAKWDEYMKAMSAFLDCGLPNFIEERFDLGSFPAFLREALRDFGRAWPLKPHSDVLVSFFESQKMRAMASFQDLYVGLEPYRNDKQLFGGVIQTTAPAVFGLLAAIELHPENSKAGVFAAEGGFEAISQSFVKLAESVGVSFQTGKTATQIAKNGVHVRNSNTKNDDKIADDSFVPADLIIVNADLPYASMSLIADSDDESTNDRKESRYDWDPSYLYSSGVLAFHWSIDKELVDLKTHNVYLAAASGRSQAEESWRLLRKGSQNTKNPTGVEPFNFYVHCPTKTDPSAAPEGCDSIMVLVPCPTLQRKKEFAKLPRDEAIAKYKEQFNEKVVTEMRQAVLDRFSVFDSLKDLKDHILDEVVDTPGTYADSYNVAAGTPFALSHGFGQLSLTRPGMHSSESNNILYCGASSRPGNGVPLVLIGSKLVSKKAISVIKKLSTG